MTCRAAGTGEPEGRISWDLKKKKMYGVDTLRLEASLATWLKRHLKCEEEETLTTEEPKKCLEAIKVSGSGTPLKTTGRESERAAPSQWRQEQKAAAENHRRRDRQTAKKRVGVQGDGGEKTDVTGRFFPASPRLRNVKCC